MEENEKKIIINIIENKYRAKYSYKRNPKDFELEQYVECVNKETKEKYYTWKRIGWYTSIDNVLIAVLKNYDLCYRDNKLYSTNLDEFMNDLNKLYETLKERKENIKEQMKGL